MGDRPCPHAAWLAEEPVAGFGSEGIRLDDADFQAFRAKIECAFGLRAY